MRTSPSVTYGQELPLEVWKWKFITKGCTVWNHVPLLGADSPPIGAFTPLTPIVAALRRVARPIIERLTLPSILYTKTDITSTGVDVSTNQNVIAVISIPSSGHKGRSSLRVPVGGTHIELGRVAVIKLVRPLSDSNTMPLIIFYLGIDASVLTSRTGFILVNNVASVYHSKERGKSWQHMYEMHLGSGVNRAEYELTHAALSLLLYQSLFA